VMFVGADGIDATNGITTFNEGYSISGVMAAAAHKVIAVLDATYGPLLPAVVTSANPQEATAALADGTSVSLHMEGMRWARPYR
ncbi:hypothetical protein MJL81_33975, partial [Salmonella enterica subsp. enterica serovar Anatum]|nr:hypothetical protein [Salmonella enterica subsp. enterica serovar Anatum]